MEGKTMKKNSLYSPVRPKEAISNMLQEEARELYEARESIPGREWAEWFAAKRLSGLHRKN